MELKNLNYYSFLIDDKPGSNYSLLEKWKLQSYASSLVLLKIRLKMSTLVKFMLAAGLKRNLSYRLYIDYNMWFECICVTSLIYSRFVNSYSIAGQQYIILRCDNYEGVSAIKNWPFHNFYFLYSFFILKTEITWLLYLFSFCDLWK